VLLDTFVVRTILVPSFLALIARETPAPTNVGPQSNAAAAATPSWTCEDGAVIAAKRLERQPNLWQRT
jgi:hypothetical protein